MIKNKKGYTLVELVISIAIIAIAGGLLATGVYNVLNLFKEASLIKTNTNEIYEKISQTFGTDSSSYTDSITFVDKVVSIPVAQETESSLEPTTIKLSYFNPKDKASMLTDDEEVEPPKTGVSARIWFLLSGGPGNLTNAFSCISVDFQQFNSRDAASYKDIGLQENCIDETIKDDSYIGQLSPYIVTPPSDKLLNYAYSQLDDKYKAMLGNNYEVRYLFINKTLSPAWVYCYFAPAKNKQNTNEKIIYISYDTSGINSSAIWKRVDMSKDKTIDLSELPSDVTEVFTVDKNGKRVYYTRSQVESLEFKNDLDPNENFYVFSSKK